MERCSMLHGHDLVVMCENIMRAYLLQADPLYMGVPTGAVWSLLRLLLLQRDVVGSADTPPLLGCSHITNALQVYLQQGVFTGVFYIYINLCEEKKCMKTIQILHVLLLLFFSPFFLPLLSGSSSPCSWKATTGAMKRRMTVTQRRKETTNWVT